MQKLSGGLFTNKQLLSIIWPLVVEQLLQMSLGLADIFMVSSLGEAAVSGVSLVDQINVLLTAIFSALATGGAVVCAQYIGSRNVKKAQDTAKQLLLSVTGIAVFLLIAGLFTYKLILKITFHGIEADVMDASQRYFLISLYAVPGIAIYNAAAALFRANGNSKISMKIAVLVNVLNIGGNAILIYVFKWDVEGVAFPTFISRTAAALVLLFCLYKGNKKNENQNYISIKGIFRTKPEWSLISKILKIGVPSMLENSSFQFGKILVMNVVASFGTGAIAANAAGNTMSGIEVIPGHAIGLAMLTVIGQCIGAGETEQAKYYTKKLLLWAYVSFIGLNVVYLSCSRWILGLLGLSNDTMNAAWAIVMTHGVLGCVFWCLSFVLPNALRAAGDANYTMIVSALSMWIVRVGLSFVFQKTRILGLMDYFGWPESFGALCVWLAMISDWIVRIIFFVIRYFSGKWLKKKVI